MNLKQICLLIIVSAWFFVFAGCGKGISHSVLSSRGPATPEPNYYGTPTPLADSESVRVIIPAKFLYRQTIFVPGTTENGLGPVVSNSNALPIPFAEFHIYNSKNQRIQQGETTPNGVADFKIPKTSGTYTLKVYSRALNDYLKVSVLEDNYANLPYSIYKTFTVDASAITSGTLDLTNNPIYAQAEESISAKIEGGAFNIYFDILTANEYIRRNISKNNLGTGVSSADSTKWWVADKVTVFWKAGFNPYSYFSSSNILLSFYISGDKQLYILGGSQGDVAVSDTDHFDDSVIIHEYGHFLEDLYSNIESPRGQHNGDFIIDPRLAWSEGWANYFQAAVLTGLEAHKASVNEDRLPTDKRFQFIVDTIGYLGNPNTGLGVAVNLAAVGTNTSEPDNVAADVAGTGIFRELSVSRGLYKNSRSSSSLYATGKSGGGLTFAKYWQAFAGEDTTAANRTNPLHYSLRNTSTFPIPNLGLFYWLLSKLGATSTTWDALLTEEKQNKGTFDYAQLLNQGTCSGTTLGPGAMEDAVMYAGDVVRSHQQMNNDFYLFYHDGNSTTLSMTYIASGNAPDLDLILYHKSYVYFEDANWLSGKSTPYVVSWSRKPTGTTESIDLTGLPAGYYVLNVKINAYNKLSSQMSGTSIYKLYKNGNQLCGTEQP